MNIKAVCVSDDTLPPTATVSTQTHLAEKLPGLSVSVVSAAAARPFDNLLTVDNNKTSHTATRHHLDRFICCNLLLVLCLFDALDGIVVV